MHSSSDVCHELVRHQRRGEGSLQRDWYTPEQAEDGEEEDLGGTHGTSEDAEGVAVSSQEPGERDTSPEPEVSPLLWTHWALNHQEQQEVHSRRLRQATEHGPAHGTL